MKKGLALVFSILIMLCAAFPACADSGYLDMALEEISLHSDIVLLANVDKNTQAVSVILEKNADKRAAPASLAKIMTAIVVLEQCQDLGSKVTVPAEALELIAGKNASNAGLRVGEIFTVEELLNCLLICSACDAAVTLAHGISGSQEAFVALMNAKAAELGCENTSFSNAIGFDDRGMYTTAYDILAITLYAMQKPLFVEITAKSVYRMHATNKTPERRLSTTNLLLNRTAPKYYHPNVTGIKTGNTEDAGRCVVSCASKNGYTYYAVVMHGSDKDVSEPKDGTAENTALLDSKNLYNWVFEKIKLICVAEPVQIVTEIPLALSSASDFLRLVPAKEQFAFVPAGVDQDSVLLQPIAETLPKSVEAPIAKGTVYGQAQVLYAGQVIATVDLVSDRDVGRNSFLLLGSKLKRVFESTAVKLIAVVLALMILGYIGLVIYVNRKKKKNRQLRVLEYRDSRNTKPPRGKPPSGRPPRGR